MLASVFKYNKCHEKPGSPKGGQFCSASGKAGGNELWRQPKPEWGEQLTAEYKAISHLDFNHPDYQVVHKKIEAVRVLEKAWNNAVKEALSEGKMTIDEAEKAKFHFSSSSREDYGLLPGELYHVTTAVDLVIQSGLKTREQLNQSSGLGLGGGASDTISFTTDPEIARGIVNAMHLARDYFAGEVTTEELIERARVGDGGSSPFLDKLNAQNVTGYSTLMPGTDLSMSLYDTIHGTRTGMEYGWWGKDEKKELVHVATTPEGSRIMQRKATHEQAIDSKASFLKAYLLFRESAGGPLDPLFFSSDLEALGRVPKSQIKVLKVKSVPNAVGYQVSSLGEWRAHSGKAVILDSILNDEDIFEPIDPVQKGSVQLAARGLSIIFKANNDCHEPAGSSKGGQFCSGGGGSKSPSYKDKSAFEFGKRAYPNDSYSPKWLLPSIESRGRVINILYSGDDEDKIPTISKTVERGLREAIKSIVSTLQMHGNNIDVVFDDVYGSDIGRGLAEGDKVSITYRLLRNLIIDQDVYDRNPSEESLKRTSGDWRELVQVLSHELTHIRQGYAGILTRNPATFAHQWNGKEEDDDGNKYDDMPWAKRPWEIDASKFEPILARLAIDDLVGQGILPVEFSHIEKTKKGLAIIFKANNKCHEPAGSSKGGQFCGKDSGGGVIEVDGVMRPTTNSNGKPIHPTEEGVRNFWRWFGNSKVVDENGRPLVVYHGTDQDFSVFEGENARAEGSEEGAFYFTRDRVLAGMYGKRSGRNVIPVYLKIENPSMWGFLEPEPTKASSPKEVDDWISRNDAWNEALEDSEKSSAFRQLVTDIKKGMADGAIVKHMTDDPVFTGVTSGFPTDIFIVIDPTTIKSAVGNDGNFDPNDKSIVKLDLKLVAKGMSSIFKFNKCHNPAGSSTGGQFCSNDNGGSKEKTTFTNELEITTLKGLKATLKLSHRYTVDEHDGSEFSGGYVRAFVGGKEVGEMPYGYGSKDILQIGDMAIDRPYQRKGLGMAMLQFARENGLDVHHYENEDDMTQAGRGFARSVKQELQPIARGLSIVFKEANNKCRTPGGSPAGGQFCSSSSFNSEQSERAKALKIPPGVINVRINVDPNAPLQARWVDSKGRECRLYSEEAMNKTAMEKWNRVKEFHKSGIARKALEAVEAIVSDQSADPSLRDTAATIAILARTGLRVGSIRERGAKVKAYGISTLLSQHVEVNGDEISFSFPGKHGKLNQKKLVDKTLAEFIGSRKANLNEGDALFNTSTWKVNNLFDKVAGKGFKIKDYRTWNATSVALKKSKELGIPKTAAEARKYRVAVGKAVAEELGNTYDVALDSYVPPFVFEDHGLFNVVKQEVDDFESRARIMDDAVETIFVLKIAPGRLREGLSRVFKYNPYHDKLGRFTTREGASRGDVSHYYDSNGDPVAGYLEKTGDVRIIDPRYRGISDIRQMAEQLAEIGFGTTDRVSDRNASEIKLNDKGEISLADVANGVRLSIPLIIEGFKQLPLDAQEALKALDPKIAVNYTTDDRALGTAYMDSSTMSLNYSQLWDMANGRKHNHARIINESAPYSLSARDWKDYDPENPTEAVYNVFRTIVRHEMGHLLTTNQTIIDLKNAMDANVGTDSKVREKWIRDNISGYATYDARETIAESFAMYHDPKFDKTTFPKWFRDFLDSIPATKMKTPNEPIRLRDKSHALEQQPDDGPEFDSDDWWFTHGSEIEDRPAEDKEDKGLAKVLKFNPYHDELGRFTTAGNAVFASPGDRSPKRGSVESVLYWIRSQDKVLADDPQLTHEMIERVLRKSVAESLQMGVIRPEDAISLLKNPEQMIRDFGYKVKNQLGVIPMVRESGEYFVKDYSLQNPMGQKLFALHALKLLLPPGDQSVTLDIIETDRSFDFNGVKGEYAGAYKPALNRIELYSKHIGTPEQLVAILAHEVSHHKFARVEEYGFIGVWGGGRGSNSKGYLAKKDLEDSDGVTRYSREWWDAAKDLRAPHRAAVDETLAEIATLSTVDRNETVHKSWLYAFDELNRLYAGVVEAEAKRVVKLAALGLSKVFKFNKCHTPSGSPKGGQFCSSAEGSSSPGFKRWFGKSVLTEGGKPMTLYHGTRSDYGNDPEFIVPTTGLINEQLGVHLAKDPRVTDAFTVGAYARDDNYNAWDKDSTAGLKRIDQYGLDTVAKPGGHVIPVHVAADKVLVIPQKKNKNGVMSSDQDAIARFVAGTVFRENREMFEEYAASRLNAPLSEIQSSNLWESLSKGEAVSIKTKTLLASVPPDYIADNDGDGFRAFVDNYGAEFGPKKDGMDWPTRVVVQFKDWAKREGYEAIQYVNTSNNEVYDGMDPTTFIVLDPRNIKSAVGNVGTYDDSPKILKLAKIFKGNKCHNPAGSSLGGQFCSGTKGSVMGLLERGINSSSELGLFRNELMPINMSHDGPATMGARVAIELVVNAVDRLPKNVQEAIKIISPTLSLTVITSDSNGTANPHKRAIWLNYEDINERLNNESLVAEVSSKLNSGMLDNLSSQWYGKYPESGYKEVVREAYTRTAIHELGHLLVSDATIDKAIAGIREEFGDDDEAISDWIGGHVSPYATINPHEFLAESFLKYHSPEYKKGSMPLWWEEMIEDMPKDRVAEIPQRKVDDLGDSEFRMKPKYKVGSPEWWADNPVTENDEEYRA